MISNIKGKNDKLNREAIDIDEIHKYRHKVFADILEALIGAVYIDS